jgi:hypothetical protein
MHTKLRFAGLAPLLALFVVTATPARADLPYEKREAATHVVSGEVIGVYQRDMPPGHWDYVVAIRVEAVQKGDGVKAGDIVYASCFKKKPGFDKPTGAGHKLIPQEKQKIKVYLKREGGRNAGIYPDWADVLK